MKQIIYKATILLPLGMIVSFLWEPIVFCIPEIGLYLYSVVSIRMVVMATVIWLCCSPFRKSCCNGTWTELLFNIVPVELVLMISFAQWHFIISVILLSILIVFEAVLFLVLREHEHRHKITKKRHRMYKAVFGRCSVLAMSVICVVPCCLSLFVYGVQPPGYEPEPSIWDRMYAENNESTDAENITDDSYQENTSLWNCFRESQWKEWSVREKITIVQKLVDFEAGRLGIPSVPVKAKMIGTFVQGAYNDESNEIYVNTEYLAEFSVDECIRTVCHEVYHAFQYYLITTLDMDNPALQTAYFEELQSWFQNQDDYKTVMEHGFDAYENQPLEVAAREYADKETEKIMNYVSGIE